MNRKQKLLLSSLIFIFSLLIGRATAQKLTFNVSSSPPVSLAICDDHGKCVSNQASTMETGGAFCTQSTFMLPTYSIYKINDLSKPANITYSFVDGVEKPRDLQNVTLVANTEDGNCPVIDPVANGNIAYSIQNDSHETLTFLQVFTTENNGSTPCSGCTNWWHYWSVDDMISLESGSVLITNTSLPGLGFTNWFDATAGSNGTRWFVRFSHGNDCFSTTFYNNSGIYSDRSNLCDYARHDFDYSKSNLAILSIRDYYAGVIPPTRDRACTITMYPVDLKYCKNQ